MTDDNSFSIQLTIQTSKTAHHNILTA